MPHFKDCIGALDGTHISATPPPNDLIRYIGRSGKPTQNVLAIVDFDMRFTYASIGKAGSMHDTNVLFHALKNDHDKFPHPPKGMHGWILFFHTVFKLFYMHLVISSNFHICTQGNIIMLMSDTQIDLDTSTI